MPRQHTWKSARNLFFLLAPERERFLLAKRYSPYSEKLLACELKMTREMLHSRIFGMTAFTWSEFSRLCYLIGTTPRAILVNEDGKVEFLEAS